MSKIKIVQIINVGDEYPTEYLDDKGRVWRQQFIKGDEPVKFGDPVQGYYAWEQLPLPEEPES